MTRARRPTEWRMGAPHERCAVLVHATCVAIGGQGVLLRGAPGAGKSDLALRLIEEGAVLVADDQVALTNTGEALLAAPPARIAGMLEVRGIGIVRMDFLPQCPVRLVVDLVPPEAVERMPEAGTVDLCGHGIAQVQLAPFEASAPAKVRLALSRVAAGRRAGRARSAG